MESFVRRLSSGYYPRFHLYIDKVGQDFVFNLHLDQKKASYIGHKMHSAEYDDALVEEEVDRLKNFFGVSEMGADLIDLKYSKIDNGGKKPVDKKEIDKGMIKGEYRDNNNLSGNLENDLLRLKVNNKKKKRFLFFNI